MTQGRDGISLAPGGARRQMGVARRPWSIAAVVKLCAALVAGTSGTSYAKRMLSDTVVVSNFGVLFNGSIETFAAGSLINASPEFFIKGSNTLLGDGNGAAGDAQSSLTVNNAVAVPLGIAGVFPNGFFEIYPFGANGNSTAISIVASPAGAPDLTGLDVNQGIAYEDPFDGLHTLGFDIIAASNFAVVAFGPDLDIPGLGLCAPQAPGFSLGTITEYNATLLLPGVNDTSPLNNSPVCTNACVATDTCPNPPGTDICPAANLKPATIGGCDTFLAGPVGVAYDDTGILFAVNSGFFPTPNAEYVTAYDPNLPFPYGGFGNVLPIAIVGSGPANPASPVPLINPTFVAVESGPVVYVDGFPLPQDIIFVTDLGDNSIKIFAPFEPETCFTDALPFACAGLELAEIKGRATKLKRPEGIALSVEGNLYVVNNSISTLEEFPAATIESVIEGGGQQNVRASYELPAVIGNRNKPKMNFPVGVALPAFSPPAE